VIVAFFAPLLLLAACGREIEPGNTPSSIPPVRGLAISGVESGALPDEAFLIGTVESLDRGTLAARIAGQVLAIPVREGDAVAAGDLLLTLAANTAEEALREAEATLAGAREAVKAARARRELAEKTHGRYRRLFDVEAVTPQEMDRAAAELEMARGDEAAAEAAVRRAASVREAAATAAGYNEVRAPYPARVVRRQVDLGTTVQPGTPLLELDRQGGWRVRTEVPETLLSRFAVGQQLEVEIPAVGKTFLGTVAEILPQADPVSRSLQMKIALENGTGLRAGLFARVRPPGGEEGPAMLVPASALVTRGQLTGVYVVEKEILRYRLVKTGRKVGDRVEILSGLRPTESVVTGGAERARSGARVKE
jgi:RND family efflux transporter MFP subunit